MHGSPLGAEELAGAKADARHHLSGVRDSRRHPRRLARRRARARPTRAATGRAASPRSTPTSAPSSSAASRATCRTGFARPIDAYKQKLAADKPKVATRKSSQMALEVINAVLPETIGGSADLTGSNLTNTTETLPFTDTDRLGRYMRYGIREHGMAAIMNGIALHKRLIPYGGTFLVFTDYARPAIRLSRDHGPARHLCDDARLDRPRRRRPDPPAGRASGGAARHPQPAGAAPRRCGRDARMLADRARDRRPALDPGAQPPEPAGAAHRVRRRKTSRPRAPT